MADKSKQLPPLSLVEKMDIVSVYMTMMGSLVYNAITGIFRGKSGGKTYKLHVVHAAMRKASNRMSARQTHYLNVPTAESYKAQLQRKGLKPETVSLPHGAVGHWIGNPNAKKVVIYYHGGGFALTARPGHFSFYTNLLQALQSNGHDVAIFFLAYTVTPEAAYPTQLRQAVEALRYILSSTCHSPADIVVGGDSAGGNLALGVLSHLSHPHPEIEQLDVSEPLAGFFAFAPWVSFRSDWPSFEGNKYKDIVTKNNLEDWSAAYLNGRPGDNWSEPFLAPAEWWSGANEKVNKVLFLAGGDEILLSPIEAFVEKFRTVVPNTTYIVGSYETHVAPVYSAALVGETQQGRELKRWLAARL